ncbi:hypothetical protein HYG86_15605 [Alkalicella caledoniensis]|uniref:Uncharacterized protein n=1 Tax=Alkalicella caledoniensis TaxID=2731377 RepID=A0A7G9WBM9_ALKCA|nr:hypothetical protein [Alkalicella caledoniensis]QNO16091.1 hypothetical protein HYG86_15605 [Alkalicella caledoniensis]
MENTKIVTVFRKVQWDNFDILKIIKEAVEEARSEQPEVAQLKLGDIGMKRFENHVQLNLYFVDPPRKEEAAQEELEEVSS